MIDDTDNLPKSKLAPPPLVLDTLSIDELEAHIDRLKAEIDRARAAIDKKKAARGAADSFFKS